MASTNDNKYWLVKSQNNLLEKNVKVMNEMYSTDDFVSQHIRKKYEGLKTANWVLFLLYYGFLIILVVFLYMTKKIGNLGKIFIIICFAIFPFVIYPIEDAIYQLIMTSYN